jgi:predicted nucleic-acid-binding Zn-ribbon protein
MGGDDEIRQALAKKGIDTACRRCGKDEWSLLSRDALLPDMAAHIEIAGGTAAMARVCNCCGYIELYNPGMLTR